MEIAFETTVPHQGTGVIAPREDVQLTARNNDIQALRAAAIILVFLHHVRGKIPISPLADGALASVGLFVGVELFLVVSGYVIIKSLISSGTVGPGRRMSGVEFRAFWRRRIFRLLPASVVWMVLGIATLFAVGASWSTIAHNAAFLAFALTGTYNIANAYCATVGGFGTVCPDNAITHIYWSLSLEEQYYFLLSVCLMIVSPRRFLAVAVAALGAFLVMRHLTWSPYVVFLDKIACRSYGLFLGCGLALVPFRRLAWLHAVHPLVRAAGMVAGLAALAVLGKQGYIASTLGVSLVAAAVVTLALPDHAFGKSPVARAMAWIGSRSYSIYLCHMPMLYLTGHAFGLLRASDGGGETSIPLTISAIGIAFAMSCVAAHLTFEYIETPFIRKAKGKGDRKSGS